MKRFLSLFTVFFIAIQLFSAEGDSTIIRVHDKVHWDWYGGKIQKAKFPDGSTSYAKIVLRYTLGCPGSGCSDWDYTTNIILREKINDSTHVNYELGKVITPYGGYLPNNWEHAFYFDITDYANLLRDSVEINAFYSGWSDGFTCTTDFIFIEGTPPRDVISVHSLHNGSCKYGDAAASNSCENRTAEQPITIDANAKTFKIKATPTGHGFNGNGYDPGNPDNCAEFCDKWFKVSIDGTETHQTQIWRDDCGVNPMFKQNGTWIYDRAGWCPGDEGITHEFEVTNQITPGNTQNIGFKWQPYSNTSPNNSNYIFDAQFVQYGDFNLATDVEIIDIARPSMNENYSRQNPACAMPLVKIRNNGGDTLTSVDFVIGLKGFGNTITYKWTGSLGHNQTEMVEIPTNGWLISENDQFDVFKVELKNPNRQQDEATWNNYKEAKFERLPYTNGIYLWLKTNNFPGENSYAVFDDMGNKVYEVTSLQPNTTYKDTMLLPDGCYTLTLYDSDCDGLSFPFNNPPYNTSNPEGTGFAQIWRFDAKRIHTYEANFGCEISHSFTVGDGYKGEKPELTSVQLPTEFAHFEVYPNPTKNQINLSFAQPNERDAFTIELYDLFGKIKFQEFKSGDYVSSTIQVDQLASGIYFLKVEGKNGLHRVEKVFVE